MEDQGHVQLHRQLDLGTESKSLHLLATNTPAVRNKRQNVSNISSPKTWDQFKYDIGQSKIIKKLIDRFKIISLPGGVIQSTFPDRHNSWLLEQLLHFLHQRSVEKCSLLWVTSDCNKNPVLPNKLVVDFPIPRLVKVGHNPAKAVVGQQLSIPKHYIDTFLIEVFGYACGCCLPAWSGTLAEAPWHPQVSWFNSKLLIAGLTCSSFNLRTRLRWQWLSNRQPGQRLDDVTEGGSFLSRHPQPSLSASSASSSESLPLSLTSSW